MAHPRQLIREAVKTLLVNANTAAGSRVYETRVVPWRQVQLPAIAVYGLTETVDAESQQHSPRYLYRTLQIEIVASVISSENVDDALDDIALEIEKAMHADPTFGSVCIDSILTETEVAVEADGQKPMGMVRLIYSVTYETLAPDPNDLPDGTFVDLQQVNPTTDFGNATQIVADDIIDGLEE